MGIIFWYSYKHLEKCPTAPHNQYNFLIRRGHTPNHINDSAHDDNENIACQKNIGASQHLFIMRSTRNFISTELSFHKDHTHSRTNWAGRPYSILFSELSCCVQTMFYFRLRGSGHRIMSVTLMLNTMGHMGRS